MNNRPLYLCLFLALLCTSGITGCSKPRIELAVASQPNVNPDHSGRPSPVHVKMFELRNDLAFKQADFFTLFNQPLQVLGADLIAADEMVFVPGEARRIQYQPSENTRFVGVVAGFRQMERAQWRMIKAVDPEEENWVSLELNDTTILVVPDKEAEDWDPEKAVKQYQLRLQQGKPESMETRSMQKTLEQPAPVVNEPTTEPQAPVSVEAAPAPAVQEPSPIEEALNSAKQAAEQPQNVPAAPTASAEPPAPKETVTIIRDGVAEIVSGSPPETQTPSESFPLPTMRQY